MKDGGRAFPSAEENSSIGCVMHPGMSLRDWFAGMVAAEMWRGQPEELDGPTAAKLAARNAYMLAEAMLAEREKGN